LPERRIKKRAATAPTGQAARALSTSARAAASLDVEGDRIALVMGAGGPVGHAFHAGVLRALAAWGWDPRAADLVVGTSAGAVAGALLRAGLSGDELFALASADGRSPLAALGAQASLFPAVTGVRRWRPASTRYLVRAIRRPWSARPGRLVSALLPEGVADNLALGEAIAQLHPARWPARPLWVTTVSLEDGARVAFGRADAPEVDLGTAVRCSAAVPWLFRPISLGPKRYVDGGMASPTHLDLLDGAEPRLVIVSSPLSRYLPLKLLLRAELARLDCEVLRFEPDDEVAACMRWNPMNPSAAAAVAEAAYRAACRRLERASTPVRVLLGG
jgi:NTE family protein